IGLCRNKDKLYISTVGTDSTYKESKIERLQLPLDINNFKSQLNLLYSSSENDPGTLNCTYSDAYLFFPHKLKDGPYTEIAALYSHFKELIVITELKFATQLVELDDKLLVPHNDKIFVLKGEIDTSIIDQLKPSKA
ncbi:hypothetical protein MHBO_005230, partial [Bonamia ostreae]